jgi:nucleoside-diphosphate-sugar epimerase
MRVLVTGGAGRIGKYLVRELADRSHNVTSLDLASPPERIEGVAYMTGNAGNVTDLYGALSYSRAEAIIHMAAWADPGIVADTRTYGENAAAGFAVLDLAYSLRLKRAILASSAQVYGFAEHPPVYAPVDEEHPLRPLNSYALAKIATEQAAAYFAGKGLNVLSLRIMGARPPEALDAEVERILGDPGSDTFLLWTRTDARDIAIGVRQALEAAVVESGVYNLTGSANVLDEPTAELLAHHCPQTELRHFSNDRQSPLSIDKARRAFGYEPRYVWTQSNRNSP